MASFCRYLSLIQSLLIIGIKCRPMASLCRLGFLGTIIYAPSAGIVCNNMTSKGDACGKTRNKNTVYLNQ